MPKTTHHRDFSNTRYNCENRMKYLAIVLCASLLVFSACAPPLNVHVSYISKNDSQQVANADKVTIDLTVQDLRANKSTIGTVFGSFNQRHSIVSSDNVPDVIQGAFDIELEARGFNLGSGPAVVIVDLNYLETEREVESWSAGRGQSLVVLNIKVKTPAGPALYSHEFYGRYAQNNFTHDGAQLVTQRALSDAVWQVFEDPKFIDALLTTRKNPP